MTSRQRTENPAADRRKRVEQPLGERREPRYHVYIRLPFNRDDFVDPEPVNWDEKKSEALWAILSVSSLENVNWTKLAVEFDVTVDFLLQMANFLTERHTSQLRAHMLKAAAARGSNAPSPVPGAEPPTYQTTTDSTRRIGSGAGRPPSVLSARKEAGTPQLKSEEEHVVASAVGPSAKSAFPTRPANSRTSSSNTPTPSQSLPGSRPGTATRALDPQRRRGPYLPIPSAQQQQPYQPQSGDPTPTPLSPAASTSSSSSSSSSSPVESRIIRRPPRFQSSKDPRGGGDDPSSNDDDDEPAFLPFNNNPQHHHHHHHHNHQAGGSAQGSGQDMGATLRGTNNNMRDLAAGRRGASSQTSDESVGSGSAVLGGGARRPAVAGSSGQGQGLASSRRGMTGLAGKGPAAGKGKGASREGSEGTPSMGSSFSDLDDASVTQSALEEALASRMQDGTIGSRMSVIGGTIGQAIRSRYLPKPNRQ